MKIRTMIAILSVVQLAAAEEEAKLSAMSLEDLMNVDVSTGSLTSVRAKYALAAITTISREQIELSTARNLATLLEQHVPGLMLMVHSEGNKIGIRGLIAAENYKLLLLVNGKSITNMVYEGAILELDQWELGDIERIEAIRGPGSVTYGTGAIAGVINIITKTADSNLPTESIGLAYLPAYRSKGGSFQHSHHYGKLGVYSFISYRASRGQQSPNYYALSGPAQNDNRYIGKRDYDLGGPQPYLADALGRPQVKAHLDVSYGDSFRAWARYTQSGQTHHFSTLATNLKSNGERPALSNRRQVALRGIAVSPEYTHQYTDTLSLKTSLTLDNQEYIRYDYQNTDWSTEHTTNIRDYAFSQRRGVGSLLMSYNDHSRFHLTTGYEFTSIGVRAPWGKGDDHIWIREGVHLISGDSSVYLDHPDARKRPSPDSVEAIGSGLQFNTHTYLLESGYRFFDELQLLYSHRLDIPDVSTPMYSPRAAILSEINSSNILRLTAQRSLRMMPLRAQYLFDSYDRGTSTNTSEHESLDSLELGYTNIWNASTVLNVHAYHNDIHAIGFTGDDLQFVSDMQIIGLEVEPRLRFGTTDIAFNHSYLKVLDIEMNDELKTGLNRNNVSYADYVYDTTRGIPLRLESYGDGLNNWSENSSRLLITHSLLNGRLVAHINSRVFWGLGSSYDEMKMYQRAYTKLDREALSPEDKVTFDEQRDIFERERSLLDKQDVYGVDFRLNASLAYRFQASPHAEVVTTIFADNLIGSTTRHYVSTGSGDIFPERLSFMKEARTFGVKMNINLN